MSFLSGLFSKKLLKRNPKDLDNETIVYPKMYINIMIICSIGFFLIYLFVLFLMIFFPERVVDYDQYSILQFSLLFLPFVIASVIFTIYLAKFKIIAKEDCFIYKNLFKKTKVYSYENLYSVLIGSAYHCYKQDKCIVKISLLLDNSSLLHKCIKSYQKKHKIIPKDSKNGIIKRTKLWIFLSVSYFIMVFIFNLVSAFYVWWWYLSLLLHIPNILFIISCLLWKISFNNGVFTKRSLFKGNKSYKIQELIYTTDKNFVFYKIYYNNKIIAIVFAIEYNSDLIENNLNYKISK